ncbi:hypothetical protein [uncultured Methylobacterium sp.]|uniref:hypothetical protein n=1 Tax=uncultured Methylobacterium sp. TaxID=157278 RepID=UPI0035CC597D
MPTFLVSLAGLQDPIVQADLVSDGEVLRLEQSLKRGLAGGPATLDLEIRNPGFVALLRTDYVAVVETPTGLLADAVTLCRARIARIPDDLGGPTIVLHLECAPSSWKGDLKAIANASIGDAGIPPFVVRTVPDPGQGVIAVAFARAVGATWATVRDTAFAVDSFIQQDLVRAPYSSLLNYQVLSIANAVLTVTIVDNPAARDAARYGAAALVAVSGDKNPRNGVLFVSGMVMGLSKAPGGRIDVTINLASLNLVQAGLATVAPGDLTAGGLPFYDPLFPGARDDLSAAAIEGKAVTWYVDPVTHAIVQDDITRGARFFDLGDLGDAASERKATIQNPVKHVKLKLIAEYSQFAAGRVDISPFVMGAAGGGITSLAYPSNGIPPSQSGGDLDFGWGSMSPKFTVERHKTVPRPTGRSWVVQYREDRMSWSYSGEGSAQKATSVWTNGTPYELEHSESAQAIVNTVRYTNWYKTFSFQQTRREVVDIVLDVDCQPFALNEDTLDLGTITLSDVNTIDGILPYAEGTAYNKGDRVLIHGHAYECLANGVVAFYVSKTTTRNGVPTTTFTTPYWRDLGAGTPMGDPRRASYFDTNRGRGSIATALNRCRAAALKRLQAMRVSKVFPWHVARDIGLRDEVRMLVRDGLRAIPVRGKVEEIRRVIEGGGLAWIEVSITVSLGTGRDDDVADLAEAYAESGYAAPAYTGSNKPTYVSDSTPGYQVVGTVGRDTEYVLTADTLFEPINAMQLLNPAYAILSILISNEANDQLSRVPTLIASGRSPEYVTQDYPTTLDVAMRPLRTEGNIERQYRTHAQLTVSPRGIDLTNGGEP